MKAVIVIHPMKQMDRQQRRLCGQQWLYQAVADCGYPEVTPETCPVERTETGKPYFASCPQIHFSISHSKEYWACAVADQPVGLDLQYHKQGRLEQIPGRFFHPQEAAWLERQTSPEAFFQIWTAKESYVKWTGQGIDRHFREFCVAEETGLRDHCEDAWFWRDTIMFDGVDAGADDGAGSERYSLCLCGGEPWDEVKIVRYTDEE